MAKTSNRNGWLRQPGIHEIDTGKGKVYRGLVKFTRPCAACAAEFAIHVTEAVADGNSHNSSFGLRNCEAHRMKMVPAGSTASIEEVEKLRMMVSVMKQEVDPLYVRNKELFDENSKLKAELHALKSKHELGPAMEAAKPAFDGKAALARELAAKNNSKIFPWGVDSP